MDRDDLVEIGKFSGEILARIAMSVLESNGIESTIITDDAGGAYPFLQMSLGVRLLVREEDEERAREVLADMGGDAENPAGGDDGT